MPTIQEQLQIIESELKNAGYATCISHNAVRVWLSNRYVSTVEVRSLLDELFEDLVDTFNINHYVDAYVEVSIK